MFLHFLQVIPPLFVAVILHEVAHGWTAERLGDPTARNAGRISLNPLVHIDPFMTLILPTLLIMSGSPVVLGGAKPVPVNVGYFKKREMGSILVSAAGPLTNFILAIVCFVFARIVSNFAPLWVATVFFIPLSWIVYGFFINIMLGVFNLIPILPLDGGRIVSASLPANLRYWYSRTERYGMLILIAALYFNIFDSTFEFVHVYAQRLLFRT